MSLSVQQSNQNLNMRDLIKERRDTNKQMQSDIASGNLSAAQNDLRSLQSMQQQIDGLQSTSSDSTPALSALSTAPEASQTAALSLVNDLKQFIQSVMSGSDQNTQAAQQQLQNDFASLFTPNTGTTSNLSALGTQGTTTSAPTYTHHVHAHHNDGDGDDISAANTSATSTNGPQTNTQINSFASSLNVNDNYMGLNSTPVTSIDGARKVAMDAYSMLMQYTNTSTGITSSQSNQINMLL